MRDRKYVPLTNVKSGYVSFKFSSLGVSIVVNRHNPKKWRRLLLYEFLFGWIHFSASAFAAIIGTAPRKDSNILLLITLLSAGIFRTFAAAPLPFWSFRKSAS